MKEYGWVQNGYFGDLTGTVEDIQLRFFRRTYSTYYFVFWVSVVCYLFLVKPIIKLIIWLACDGKCKNCQKVKPKEVSDERLDYSDNFFKEINPPSFIPLLSTVVREYEKEKLKIRSDKFRWYVLNESRYSSEVPLKLKDHEIRLKLRKNFVLRTHKDFFADQIKKLVLDGEHEKANKF